MVFGFALTKKFDYSSLGIAQQTRLVFGMLYLEYINKLAYKNIKKSFFDICVNFFLKIYAPEVKSK